MSRPSFQRATATLILIAGILSYVYLGLTLFTLAVIFYAAAIATGLRRQRTLAETCPRCLAVGTLAPQDSAACGKADPEWDVRQCRNLLDDDTECGFSLPPRLLRLPRCYFPTLGLPGSGKTQWLAMAFRQISYGNVPSTVWLESLRTDASQYFDHLVHELLVQHRPPAATQTATLPAPLAFLFRDRDPLGPSQALAMLFDYGGEILRGRDLEVAHRRRAAQADGMIFFLDPTAAVDEHARALADFREDRRLFQSARRVGERFGVPLAVCVSKLDLLPTVPLARGARLTDEFYRALKELDQTFPPMSHQLIQRRSEATMRLCETMWPGWAIRRQLEATFGERVAFFPVAPLGLQSFDDHDLSRRTISPYGMLEPLLWLLHMNGFRVSE